MNCAHDPSLEDYRWLPGLYRRWELTEVCEPNRNYQIEDAGIIAWNRLHCLPPLDDEEVEVTVRNIAAREVARREQRHAG